MKTCEASNHMALPRIIKSGLLEADNGMERIQNALDEETLTQLPKLEANVGYLGTIAPSKPATAFAQICTVIYFAYFVLMPWYTRVEKTKPVPDRITTKATRAAKTEGA